MKKVDYYAVQGPWKMPKWMGGAIGGLFAVMAVGSACAIHSLTKGPEAPAALAAAPALAPAPTERPAVTLAPAAAAPHEAATVPVATKAQKSGSHHKASRSHQHASKKRVMLAKRSPVMSDSRATAILAKRDSRSNRRDKDALDKLLGL